MKKILHTCALLLSLAALAACEIPFALDNVSEPCIYVQFIPSNEYATALVAYAEPAFKKGTASTYTFDASEISVSADGKQLPFEFVEPEEGELYMLNSRTLRIHKDGCFKPGEKVELAVRGHGKAPDVHARTTMPPAPEIGSVTITPLEKGGHTVALKMSAPVKDGEYYGLKAVIRETVVSFTMPSFPSFPGILPSDLPDIPSLIQLDTTVYVRYEMAGQLASTADLNSLDLDAFANVNYSEGFMQGGYSSQPMMLLSSRQFSDDGTYSFYMDAAFDFDFLEGLELPEDLDVPEGEGDTPAAAPAGEDDDGEDDPDKPDDDVPPLSEYILVSRKTEYRLEVFRLSEELFNYCKAQYLSNFDMLSNFGVSPPNFTYSNIVGGIGITGGLTSAVTPWYVVEEISGDDLK
ncbi:MAG: DUF4249 family protein [Bacteroidales bacterium]|nr:DUF4249 family protein [Bacteroidales bacterium]